ncbi:hypothetical protein MAPG_11308 [Magnaporthiopsis poae ATCC 64411]|uniref:PD-(D/E)XK nuclease-like domain-containing protein n=1 Tax=Magnaporthiopsis poae (strain ATCC 64411 / 73-15) TaxID=644358 RepID=A0A0C4EEX6_MAGP6|nr:hypothetical protein MAPG_11308 [Magnaporthiopsis poae ATCC 64411]
MWGRGATICPIPTAIGRCVSTHCLQHQISTTHGSRLSQSHPINGQATRSRSGSRAPRSTTALIGSNSLSRLSRRFAGRPPDEMEEDGPPRARLAYRPPRSAGSLDTSSTTSRTRSSDQMSAPERRRRRRMMELGREPVNTVSFATVHDSSHFCPNLLQLLTDFNAVNGGGRPFVSHSCKNDLAKVWNFAEPESVYFEPSGANDGTVDETLESPALSDVRNLLDTAVEYTRLEQDEAGWNAAVYFPLLRLAVPQHNRVDITPCTAARIQPGYIPSGTPNGKNVGMCLTIDPVWPKRMPHSTHALQAIRSICLGLPGLSINHTEFRPLCDKPIAVSIETKRAGTHVDDSHLQLGVWQAAHWNMLETLASQSAMEDLGFLPSIYIVGHEWKFAAATRSGGRTTTLWTDCTIGSTSSIQGIYRIVWCIRRLVRYSTEVYWPWFESNVLSEEQEGAGTAPTDPVVVYVDVPPAAALGT